MNGIRRYGKIEYDSIITGERFVYLSLQDLIDRLCFVMPKLNDYWHDELIDFLWIWECEYDAQVAVNDWSE